MITDDTYLDKPHRPSLTLQILLFINVYLAPFWFISSIIISYNEFDQLSTIHMTLSLLSIILISPIEVLRLYLGYSGNLKDKIPDFAGFWILSTFLQFPLHLYLSLAAPQVHKYTISFILQIVTQVILSFEIIISFFCIKRSSRERAELFHLQQLIMRSEKKTNVD